MYSYGFFWFKKGYNDDLKVVTYVFGPSQEYFIKVVSHKSRSFSRKVHKKTPVWYVSLVFLGYKDGFSVSL